MLFVGRVSKEKNLDLIVSATRRLAEWRTPVRPIIVGDGPYMPELKRLLGDAIFTGYLGGEDLAKAYASADLFAFPSTTDTFGNVILEAQASGIPVIVSDSSPRPMTSQTSPMRSANSPTTPPCAPRWVRPAGAVSRTATGPRRLRNSGTTRPSDTPVFVFFPKKPLAVLWQLLSLVRFK
jgi:hypothetical protein